MISQNFDLGVQFYYHAGDFNSRTGKYEDYIPVDFSMENTLIPKQRNNYDNVVNKQGKKLLQIRKPLSFAF